MEVSTTWATARICSSPPTSTKDPLRSTTAVSPARRAERRLVWGLMAVRTPEANSVSLGPASSKRSTREVRGPGRRTILTRCSPHEEHVHVDLRRRRDRRFARSNDRHHDSARGDRGLPGTRDSAGRGAQGHGAQGQGDQHDRDRSGAGHRSTGSWNTRSPTHAAAAVITTFDPEPPPPCSRACSATSANPRPTPPAVQARVPATVETLENPVPVLRWDPGTAVLDDDPDHAAVRFDPEAVDSAAMEPGVGDEVDDDLLEAALVGPDDGIGGRRHDLHRHLPVGQGLYGVEHQLPEEDLLGRSVDGTDIDPGDLQEVLDQPLEAVHLPGPADPGSGRCARPSRSAGPPCSAPPNGGR